MLVVMLQSACTLRVNPQHEVVILLQALVWGSSLSNIDLATRILVLMSIIELSLLNDNNPINSLNPIIDLNTWQNELFATYLSQFGVSRIIVQVGLIPISDPQMMVWSLLQTIR